MKEESKQSTWVVVAGVLAIAPCWHGGKIFLSQRPTAD
jgi:hypothetical protein